MKKISNDKLNFAKTSSLIENTNAQGKSIVLLKTTYDNSLIK